MGGYSGWEVGVGRGAEGKSVNGLGENFGMPADASAVSAGAMMPRAAGGPSGHHAAGGLGGAEARGPRPAFLSFPSLWRNVTFLLSLTTFAALLITRELDVVTIFLFAGFLLLAWAMKTAPRFWQPWMGMVVTIGVIVILARMAPVEYFRSLLRLLLFLILFKCFTLRTSRDYLQVQILCFFVLVATSVITVNFLFSIMFPVYLLLQVMALALYAIGKRREAIEPGWDARRSKGAAPWSRLGTLSPRFLGAGAAGSAVVLGLVVFFFFFIPHYSLQKLDAPLSPRRTTPNSTAVTGFGEDVKLGDFKKIEPDGTVVMRVEPQQLGDEPMPLPDHLRLRGVVLDIYENNRWRRNSTGRRGIISTLVRDLQIEEKSILPTTPLLQKIYQNPDITLRLFGASFPVRFRFDDQIWARRDTGVSTYQATGPGKPGQRGFTDPFVYGVISAVPVDTVGFLEDHARWQRANPNRLRDPRYRLQRFDYFTNTQLPQDGLIFEIRDMAGREAPGPTSADRVLQMLDFFRGGFTYTLEPGTPDGVDPIRAFLFQTRAGHCEFFATSLVLMLRAQGIPARMVNGFYSTEWNQAAGVFVVKQSDAHSWVEVWLDGVGWVTVDPTPPSSAGSGAYPTMDESPTTPITEFARMWWQRNIIDYTAGKQASLYARVGETRAAKALGAAGGKALGVMVALTGAEMGVSEQSELLSIAVALALLALVGLAIVWGGLRILGSMRRSRRGEPPVIDYFGALMRKLEKLGVRRKQSQTALELVEAARERVANAERLEWIVELYYAERFSGAKAGAEERRSAMQIIEGLAAAPGSRAT